jgi:hypothetical protein
MQQKWWKWGVCGWRKGDVFSVSSPGIFLTLDASRQEKSNSSAGTRNACILPWCGSPEKNLPLDLGRFIMRKRAGKIQKNIVPPSKIVNRGGETIPRCWSSGCGHGGSRSELLALAKLRLEPTDSSVKLVLT